MKTALAVILCPLLQYELSPAQPVTYPLHTGDRWRYLADKIGDSWHHEE